MQNLNMKNSKPTATRLNEYKMIKLIGEGTYGKVYEAQHIESGKTVAIKHIKLDIEDDVAHRMLIVTIRELEILYKLSKMEENNYTIRLLDCFTTDEANANPDKFDQVWLVTDFYEFDLRQVLDNESYSMTEDQAITLIYNFLISLKFLNSAGVVHRDIKPGNILINEHCNVKICDFGLSRALPQDKKEIKKPGERYKDRPLSPIAFTRWYRPPEVILQNENYDTKADIWSFGCVVSEILKNMIRDRNKQSFRDYIMGRILFRGKSCYPTSPAQEKDENGVMQEGNDISQDDQLIKILSLTKDTELKKTFFEHKKMYQYYQIAKQYNEEQEKEVTLEDLHKNLDPQFIELMQKCLKLDPKDRATVEECLELPIFKDIRSVKYEAEASKAIYVKLDLLKFDEKTGHAKEYNMKSLQKYMVKLVQKVEGNSSN